MDIWAKLREKPFFLDEESLAWVRDTLSSMTLEQKVGHLFCLIVRRGDSKELEETLQVLTPAGFMYRQMPLERAAAFTKLLRERIAIPMLIAANLEKGGDGVLQEGTPFSSPMGVAATDDEGFAYKLGAVCAEEAAAAGVNWAFAPVADIDNNFRNPITNTRTYGADARRVRRMTQAYCQAVQERGLAACLKHFPGDGCDERDQHLVTSVNSLNCEAWDESYGEIYRAGIEQGVLTVMCGHIMQPAWSKRLDPQLEDGDILPASLSRELLQGLLREHCGFNGVIVTDATTMAGFTIPLPRRQAVPQAIAAGADLFLFTRNLKEDYQYMMDGVQKGVITPERLDEAVARTLALKAALGLHRPASQGKKPSFPVGDPQFHAWARDCADHAITLVKEQPGVLPLSVKKYPRVLYYPIENEGSVSSYGGKAGACGRFEQLLRNEGFQVEVFRPDNFLEGQTRPAAEFEQNYDVILYLANLATKSNQTTVRIEWQPPMGANCPLYLNSVPTVFISVENPYHLLDVPRVKTYINTYYSAPDVLDALMDKLMGRSAFCGKSPVDAFCGKWDTRL